ncbi:MAG: hypothetical protein KKD44_07290 [Proteobacteria bacterium]|nr:hypothetical protein [Pseudomonadota bacterium]
MTLDDKKKCAEVWEMMSGEKTNPDQWTESAGNALAKMVASIISCSRAMSYVPKPSGSRPGYSWLVKQVFNIFKQRFGMNKSLIFKSCAEVRLWQWKSVITTQIN